MKKFVKPLVIAASVAAVAGIGAVSFAKWEAGTANTKDVTGNTLGAVSVLKFGDTSTTAVTGLLPIDQNTDAYNASTNKLYGVMEFNIEKSDAYAYSDFKLKVQIDKGSDSYAAATKFYVSKTAPTAAAKGDEITASGVTLTYSIASGSYSLYICHDSADMGDMNNGFKLTLTLEDGTTAA